MHMQLPGAIKAVSKAAVGSGCKASRPTDAPENDEVAYEEGQATGTHADWTCLVKACT